MLKNCLTIAAVVLTLGARAQDSLWTLDRAVKYAVENNLDIKQNVLNQRLTELQVLQNRLSVLPGASISSNVGRSFGRSIDPTTNLFDTKGYTFFGLNGNVDVLLFGWFQKWNTISQSRFLNQASRADLDQLKDDISLNVATGFLRILLAKEQINITENQLKFSLEQMEQTEAFVQAGRSPELDLAQMQAQVATDSSNYFTAVTSYQQSVLDMKAVMNFEISAPFYAVAPDVARIPVAEISTLSPEQVYALAKDHFGSVRGSELRVQAARKGLAVSRGNLYPQLALSGQFGTNFSTNQIEYISGTERLLGYYNGGDVVDVNGSIYNVNSPVYTRDTRTTPFGDQVSQNFRQTVALSLTVPLFNGWATRTNINRAQIDLQSRQVDVDRTRLKLKQDVFKAYFDATAAIQKYYAAARAEEASGRAYNYAQKRYELGLMNALELLTTQNTAFKAKSEALSARYDLLFKLKVIDYYMGKEIKL